jgi:enoyl-CoA hydratase/carnithine racemase
VVKIQRPPDNSLSIDLMDEIKKAHEELGNIPEVKAVILTSESNGFFSNGLDTFDLLKADNSNKLKIFESLYDMSFKIYSFEKIHVSLINGHVMGGGAIMSAMSDFRMMLSGPYRFCFSEVKMGLIMPEIFLSIIKGFAKADINEIVLQAKAYKPHEALTAGLVHNIFEPESSLKQTLKFLSRLIESPLSGYAGTKKLLRKKIIEEFKNSKDHNLEQISRFFTDDFTAALTAIQKKFERRPG